VATSVVTVRPTAGRELPPTGGADHRRIRRWSQGLSLWTPTGFPLPPLPPL